MFFLFPKDEIKKIKFYSNFQQISYSIKSITCLFVNVVKYLTDSIWDNNLLHRSR